MQIFKNRQPRLTPLVEIEDLLLGTYSKHSDPFQAFSSSRNPFTSALPPQNERAKARVGSPRTSNACSEAFLGAESRARGHRQRAAPLVRPWLKTLGP